MKMTAAATRNELLNFIDASNLNVETKVNPKRVFRLNQIKANNKPFLYIMTRDFRIYDNWGLLFANELAAEYDQPLIVLLFLDKEVKINSRKLSFTVEGIKDFERELKTKNITFSVLLKTQEELLSYLSDVDPGGIVVDFSSLKESKMLNKKISENINSACFEVDSHNIIPCRHLSSKEEFSAATIRPKVKNLIYEFLTEYPEIKSLKKGIEIKSIKNDFSLIEDKSVERLKWLDSGPSAAEKMLLDFIENKLEFYSEERNDPVKKISSNLSPYVHFGQISSQRIALDVLKSSAQNINKESFLEELIVRKELADNFCFHNENYKQLKGLAQWAQDSLKAHSNDIRTYVYSIEDFENAKTHDMLWNAAQYELLNMGKMHSYMRMYWAKKILEWSKTPQEALDIAIYLNDKYSIDGLDPNGYVGILWSIGGLHDRPWNERNVFGKIRYMNYEGCKRKFEVDKYIKNNINE